MADTLVTGNVSSSLDEQVGLWGPYYINTSKAVIVFIDEGNDCNVSFTDDGGATWADTEIRAGSVRQLAVYFDRENPGDTGNLAHIVFLDAAGTDTMFYISFNIDTGSLGTLRTVMTITMDVLLSANRVAITKTRDGSLIIAASTQTDIVARRSTDNGVTWDTIATPFETATEEDWILLFCANTGDDADAAALFWDRSADEISIKMFDFSLDTWTETLILASMFDDNVHMNMNGATRHSDGLILGCAHSDDDTSGDDLRTFTINPNSIASPTIVTSTANVFTNTAESAQCAIHINQQNDDVRICYMIGGLWVGTVDLRYKLSIDNMASWGTEAAYSEAAADDLRICSTGRSVDNSGGLFQPAFYLDDAPVDIFINLVNDVAISAVAAGGGATQYITLSGEI